MHMDAVEWRFGSQRAREVMERLTVEAFLDRFPDQLSGGERRRVEVALALLRGPLCLLADEPFRGIEPTDTEVIARALRAMATEGAAVVVTGHEVPALMDLADEVVWMVAGTTHALGSVRESLVHEQFRREYLGPRWEPVAVRAPFA